MQFKSTFASLAAIVGLAAAQSITDVLAANSGSLSTLTTLLQGQPAIVDALSKAQNITILAPNNAAFEKFLAIPGNADAAAKADVVAALLQYHVISAGVLKSTDFTATPAFVPTLLTNATYTSLKDGQVVEGVAKDGGVSIYSGNRAESKVATADVAFDGGVIHVIDTVLTIPGSISETAAANNLTQLTGALTKVNLVDTVDGLEAATVFAPTNEAFEKIASVAAGLTDEELAAVLTYHVVPAVAYSSDLVSGDVATVNGATVKVEVSDAGVKVNDATVVVADVLVSNGVVHVIDAVLIPSADNSTSSSTAASSGMMPTATSSGTAPTATFTGAASRPTGAIAAAVVLGAGIMAAGAM